MSEHTTDSAGKRTVDDSFLAFMEQYTRMLQEHLLDVRDELGQALSAVMDGAVSLDGLQAAAKRDVANWLDAQYIHPNATQMALTNDRQAKVDAILEDFEAGVELGEGSGPDNNNGQLKHVDSELAQTLCQMTAALSADDVVGQKLAHFEKILRVSKDLLTEMLTKNPSYLDEEVVKNFQQDLLTKTEAIYSTTAERKIFHKYFKALTS